MCGCNHFGGKHNVNGQPGYYWNSSEGGGRKRDPFFAPLADGETLLAEEPGRCAGPAEGHKGGGIDSHCLDLRLVMPKYGSHPVILVLTRDGAERVEVKDYTGHVLPALLAMDSNARYFTLSAIYKGVRDAARAAETRTRDEWAAAFIQKRIKKTRRNRMVYVNIVTPAEPAPLAVGA